MTYRLSPSSISTFRQCPFKFYCKINKIPGDTEVDNSYGAAGNAVHQTLEYYYKTLTEIPTILALNELRPIFEEYWDSYNIVNYKLDKDLYWLCVINGIKLNLKHTHLEYEFGFQDPVNFIGYADIINTKDHWIGDWKTSTYKKSKVYDYKEQLKYYSYAYYKEYKVIPNAWVYFNKVNKKFAFEFTEEDMAAIEQELKDLKKEIDLSIKTNNFERNPSRNNCFFCQHKNICATDLLREPDEEYKITFHLKKNKLLIEGAIDESVHQLLEDHINFELKNAFFIKKAMAAKGIKYDAIKRQYKRKAYGAETVIGYLNTAYSTLKTYAKDNKKYLKIYMNDSRQFNPEITVMPTKLDVDFAFYDYQHEAVTELIKNRWGICEVGTGGGKTLIAAECIRQLQTKTLFIIDNKDLLKQTKDEYEKMLGVKCGIVGMGLREWDYPIVLCTIQTLYKNCKEFALMLAKFNLVICDEVHIWASKSFEEISKYLINTKYRFGFSATAKRDDGNDKVIYAHCGEVVYSKKAQELINEDVLIRPTALFYKYEAYSSVSENWQNEYNDGIVDGETRNKLIIKLANDFVKEGKSVMILCKMVRHCEHFIKNIEGSQLIYGKTDDDLRYDILEAFKENKFKVLIGNLKIFNKGINIKNLDVLINAAGNAGDVVTVQTIGRILRKNPGKTEAHYIDFIDPGTYLYKHSKSRMEALKDECYDVKIIEN
jgi:superfamily II DNA or RNA helicase/CRISPR/Cas system-associated exonuclease Cas4 (RecB family)